MVSVYLSYILALRLAQESEMHLWYDGEASVIVDNANQSINAASFIDMLPFAFRFTEGECTVSKTLRFFHDPHILILQILRFEHGQLAPTVCRQIHVEAFGVKWYLQQSFTKLV